MHGHKGLTRAQVITSRGAHADRAAPGGDTHHVAVDDTAQRHIACIHAEQGFFRVTVQPRHASAAAHAVPLIAQPPGIEMQWKTRVGFFRRGFVRCVDEACTA